MGAIGSTGPASALASGEHALGALPPADFVPAAAPKIAATTLPASVDLTTWAAPVGNQGSVGSCVAWAIDYGMLGWYSRHDGQPGQPFAPMYTYSQINGGVDNGSYPLDALNVALSQGSDTKVDYQPQGDYNWWDKPTLAQQATRRTIASRASTPSSPVLGQTAAVGLLKEALATNHPVSITIRVRPGFELLDSNPMSVDSDVSGTVRGKTSVGTRLQCVRPAYRKLVGNRLGKQGVRTAVVVGCSATMSLTPTRLTA